MLSEMKPAQKTQLELVFKYLKNFQMDEVLWNYDEEPDFAILIQKGTFVLFRENGKVKDVCGPGCYVGEVAPMLKGQKTKSKVMCSSSDGAAYVLYKNDFLVFLNKNPGLLVYFSDIELCI